MFDKGTVYISKKVDVYDFLERGFEDELMNLVEEGVLTKVVACSPCACSAEFYHWASKNEKMVFMPQPIMLDPFWLAKQ